MVSVQSSSLEKVSLQLHWKYQFEFAGFIAAKEKGFYKDVGLDVQLKEYQDGISVEDEVINGKSNYGIYNSNILLSYLKDRPIMLVGSFFKRSALVMVTKPDIKKLEDFKGKRVVVTSDEAFDFNFKYMFNQNGIYKKDLILIPHTNNSNNLDRFINNEIDAFSAFISDQPYKLDMKNIDYNIIDPSDYGMYNLHLELFTSQDEAHKHPKRTQKFKEASIKGWEYALSHKEEIIDIIKEKYNQKISKEVLRDEAKATKQLILPNMYKIGSFDENFIKRRIELFRQNSKDSKSDINIDKKVDDFLFDIKKLQPSIDLTKEEREWIVDKKEINICTYPNRMPFEKINSEGEYIGILSEYMRLFSKKLNIKLTLQKSKNKKESREYLKSKKCDMIVGDIATTELKELFLATKPYITIPIAFAIHADTKGVQDFSQIINDGKIAVVKDDTTNTILKSIYNDIDILAVDSILEGLEMVRLKQTISFVAPISSVAYYIQNGGLLNVHIGGTFKSDIKLSSLVNRDLPQLLSILNKAIDTITQQDRNKILNKWTSVTYKKAVDYALLWQMLGIFLIILTIIIVAYLKQRQLHTKIKFLNENLENKVEIEVEKNRQKDKLMLQQSRLAQMGEIISMIAHQWRQPLNSISILNQTIVFKYHKGNLDDKFIEHFQDSSNKRIAHMSKTIDDFRDFFKPEKERVEFCINNTITDTIEMVKPIFTDHDVELSIDIDRDYYTTGYPNELGQALLNILTNAKDALVEKEIEEKNITISIVSKDKKINLTISDNAGGVPDSIMEKIYDPYFSTKDSKNGTGLGLYMTKIIIEEHIKGILNVTNSHKGAVFTIVLEEVI